MITSKHGTTIFFSHYNLFQGKLEEKLARKARVNTKRAGLSLRAGGRGFSPATKREAPGYFYWKIKEK